jgi:hypothetical protein
MTNPHVDEIVAKLTERAICEALGVSSFSVKSARSAGRFPASWFRLISEMCAVNDVSCPIEVFNMRTRGSTKDLSDTQGNGVSDV